MTGDQGPWTIEHVSQSNPRGAGQDDVPALLRRVAATLEDLGKIDVQDLVFHSELTEDAASWPAITVYFHRDS